MSPKQRRHFRDMEALFERLGENSDLSELSDDEDDDEDELSQIRVRRGLGESSEASSSDEDIWHMSSKQRHHFIDVDAFLERIGENSELSELSDEDDDEDEFFQIPVGRGLGESSETSSTDENNCRVASSKSTEASYTITAPAAPSTHQEPLSLKSEEMPFAKAVDMEEATTTTTPTVVPDSTLATAPKSIHSSGQHKAEERKLLQNQLPNDSGTAADLKHRMLWFNKPFKGKLCPGPLNPAGIQESGTLTGTGDDFPQTESSRLDAEALCDRYTGVSTAFTNAALENKNCSTKTETCSRVDEVHGNEIIPNSSNSASLLEKHNSVNKDKSAQPSSLKKHSLINGREAPHKCEICDRNFFQLKHLKSHSVVHTRKIIYKCKICEKIFKHQSYLRNHIYFVHEGKRRHKCDKCGKCFVSLADLKRHYLIHEGRKPHKCEVCEKSFTQASYLKTHSQMHEGIRPHRCELCEKSYMSTSDLKIHKLAHEGIKPHKCEICDRSYIRASDLRRHKLNHEGKKPYKCEICDKSFVLPSPFRRHFLSHEGVKPFKCEVCDKRFTRAPHLKRHSLIHDKVASLTQ